MNESGIEQFRDFVQVIPVVRITVPALEQEESAPSVGEYSVDAKIKGLFARVKTTFSIFNPNHRVLEGELEFPLPDNAVICGYAIDIQGTMVEGRVVEKEKARIAFENEVKKGIDPGLVEHVKGNIYRTRIYPIPADGSRMICVEYVTPLTVSVHGDAALFLPMPQHHLKHRSVEISVEIPGISAPVIGGLGDKRFESAQAVWRVSSDETDVKPSDHLLIGLPAIPQTIACIEKCDDDLYFSASFLAKKSDNVSDNQDIPKNWRVIWDASGSRNTPEIEKSLKFLQVLPEKAEYELHIFRNTVEQVCTFSSRSEFIHKLEDVKYDGGTCFESLKEIADKPYDGLTLLFSDGLDTFTGKWPLFGASSVAMISGVQRDVSALKRMCGGRLFNLDIMSAEDALKQILENAPVVSEVQGTGVSDVQGIGDPAEGYVTVLGRVQASCHNIHVVLSDHQTIDLELPQTAKTDKTLSSAWAARRISELSSDAENHREELLSLGRHFSIISPVSSMIVFERLEQWLEYEIEPPESLKDIHEQWMKKHKSKSQIEADEKRARENWINSIRNEWQKRVEWWNNPVPQMQFPKSGVFEEAEIRDSAPASFARRALDAVTGAISNAVPAMMGSRARSSAPMMARMASAASGSVMAERSVSFEDCCAEPPASAQPSVPDHAPFEASVTIKAWDPDTPYLTALKDTKNIFSDEASLYKEYLKQRSKYQSSPSFYLDCAGFFFKENKRELAIRILSNLSELKLEDTALLRIYAWRLREAGELDDAIVILRKIIQLRPDEAVSWRDLAITLTIRAKRDMNPDDVSEALKCYHKAVFNPWKRSDAKWTSLVALEEFNALAAWSEKQKWSDKSPVIPEMDDVYKKNLDTDVRIVLMWDADNTDIDLHVLEPSGEEIYYGHQRSQTGGLLSFDVTTGYGPEEFLHKNAPKGIYKVMTNYFASHQQKLTGPVTVTVTVFTNWARDNETSQILSLRLEKAKDKVSVGSIEV